MTSQSPQQTTPAGLRALVTGYGHLSSFNPAKRLNALSIASLRVNGRRFTIDLTCPSLEKRFEILKEEPAANCCG